MSAGSSSRIPSGAFSCLIRSTGFRLRTSSQVAGGFSRAGRVAAIPGDASEGALKKKVTLKNKVRLSLCSAGRAADRGEGLPADVGSGQPELAGGRRERRGLGRRVQRMSERRD